MQFPNKVCYFEGAEDVPGERQKSILRVKEGHMAVVYRTDDPHWWLGKARRCSGVLIVLDLGNRNAHGTHSSRGFWSQRSLYRSTR